MEVKLNLELEQLLILINQLSIEEKQKIKVEIEKSLHKEDTNKRTFGILKGKTF
jgi:hypothetical protein